MASKQEVLDKLKAANDSLTGVAADVAALKAKIEANGSVDQEIVDQVNALSDRLAAVDAETPAEDPTPSG